MKMKNFEILGIDHIALVSNGDFGLINFLKLGLGLEAGKVETVSEQKAHVQKFEIPSKSESMPALELLEPTESESVIQKYREKNKSGIHHIALRVSSLEAAIAHLLSLGIKMIDEKPRIGHNKSKIAFIHPKSVSGILVELVEK